MSSAPALRRFEAALVQSQADWRQKTDAHCASTAGADAVSLFLAEDSKCGRSYNMGAPPSASFATSAFNLVS